MIPESHGEAGGDGCHIVIWGDLTNCGLVQTIYYILKVSYKSQYVDFPGGTVDRNLSANAPLHHRFDLWSGKIPHVVEQLSPCTSTTGAHALELMLCNKRGHCNEDPHSPQLEKALGQQWRP